MRLWHQIQNLNFASNNFEYNKLKASTLPLHVTNRKASSHIMYKFKHFKKIRDTLS